MIKRITKDLHKSIQEIIDVGESHYGGWWYDVDVRDGGEFQEEDNKEWCNALYSPSEVLSTALNKLIKIKKVLETYE